MAGDGAEQDTPSEIDSELGMSVYELRDEVVRFARAAVYSALISLSFDELILDQCDRKQVALNILSGLQKKFYVHIAGVLESFRSHALKVG
jgi:hypothetical protein